MKLTSKNYRTLALMAVGLAIITPFVKPFLVGVIMSLVALYLFAISMSEHNK